MSPPAKNPARDEIEDRLLTITERVGKTYGFDNDHDPKLPIDVFFQDSDEGLVLFLIFYTRACRWSVCSGCTLPSTSSQHHIDFRAIMTQIDHVFAMDEVVARAGEIRKVIVSNQGSVLDEATFSSTALMYLIARINAELSGIQVVCLETRPEYVDEPELEFLARAVAEGPTKTVLELAIGFEAFDDTIRNKHYKKGTTQDELVDLVDKIVAHKFHLKFYFMQKPVVEMNDEEAVADICAAIDYLADISARRGVFIGMHLNPTYAARGTPLGASFIAGDYQPPKLIDVARAVRHAKGKGLHIYVGLNDEGLAVPGGSFVRPGDEPLIAELVKFNRTNDYAILDALFEGGPKDAAAEP